MLQAKWYQTFKYNWFRSLFILPLSVLFLSACVNQKRLTKLAYVEKPVEVLYLNAMKKVNTRRWLEASEYFDEVERQHPYSDWARRAMLMSAFSHYQAKEYDQAITSAERFISLHPGNRSAAYAYYLIAICYYERILDVEREQNITMNAMAALQQVINRFSDTDYAKDAQHKMLMVRDHLAGKDMEIGRWYLRRNQFLSAINRFKYVVDHYQNTSQTEEALHRLVEAYISLGVLEEARRIGLVFGLNYPDSQWYKRTYSLMKKYGLNTEQKIVKKSSEHREIKTDSNKNTDHEKKDLKNNLD